MQSSVRVHGNFGLGMARSQLCTHREGPRPCWLPIRGGMGTHMLRAAIEVMVGHVGCPQGPSPADPGSSPPPRKKPFAESPALLCKLRVASDERSHGAVPALPPNQPRLHGSGWKRGDSCRGKRTQGGGAGRGRRCHRPRNVGF